MSDKKRWQKNCCVRLGPVIWGTGAVEDRELIKRLCQRFAEAMAVSLVARDGKIAIHGWQTNTVVEVLQ